MLEGLVVKLNRQVAHSSLLSSSLALQLSPQASLIVIACEDRV